MIQFQTTVQREKRILPGGRHSLHEGQSLLLSIPELRVWRAFYSAPSSVSRSGRRGSACGFFARFPPFGSGGGRPLSFLPFFPPPWCSLGGGGALLRLFRRGRLIRGSEGGIIADRGTVTNDERVQGDPVFGVDQLQHKRLREVRRLTVRLNLAGDCEENPIGARNRRVRRDGQKGARWKVEGEDARGFDIECGIMDASEA